MAEISAAVIDAIQKRTLQASEHELYSGIGEALPAAERTQFAEAAYLTPSDLFAIGRDFYERLLRPAIEDLICGQLKYCDNRDTYDTATDIVKLVAEEVGKVLSKTHGLPDEAGETGGRLVVAVSAAVLKEG